MLDHIEVLMPRVIVISLLMICLTIYQSSHSCYTYAHSSSIKSKESVAIRNFSSQNIKHLTT